MRAGALIATSVALAIFILAGSFPIVGQLSAQTGRAFDGMLGSE